MSIQTCSSFSLSSWMWMPLESDQIWGGGASAAGFPHEVQSVWKRTAAWTCCWEPSTHRLRLPVDLDPGSSSGRRPFQTRRCLSSQHRPGPLWSPWAWNLRETQSIFTSERRNMVFFTEHNREQTRTGKQALVAQLSPDFLHYVPSRRGSLYGVWRTENR